MQRMSNHIVQQKLHQLYIKKHRKAYYIVLNLTNKIINKAYDNYLEKRKHVYFVKNCVTMNVLMYIVKKKWFARRLGIKQINRNHCRN